MSLRDKLAAKTRRRTVFHVEVTDAEDARRRVSEAQQRLTLQQSFSPTADDTARREELQQAETDLAQCYEAVEFHAATPVDYEAIAAAHFSGSDEEKVDVDTVLPVLAAACAVDEELRDEDWWKQTLNPETSTWSVGERQALYSRLVELNITKPDVRIPKG